MIQQDKCKHSINAGINHTRITAVVLAGGLARRMGGVQKALLPLNGRCLIEHILDKLAPQVSKITINANSSHASYEPFGYKVIADKIEGFAGPLAGMASVLQAIDTEYLLVTPCDSPFIPPDFADRLMQALSAEETEIAVAHDGKRLQPVFALLHKQVLPSLLNYLQSGQHKIDKWYSQHKMATADFSDIPDTFININTPEELKRTELHLVRQEISLPVIGFAAHSGSGKTTLLKQLIPILRQKQIRLGLIKHAHHNFDVDTPGKDSYELRKAGAAQVLVGSNKRWALMTETPDIDEKPTLSGLIKHLDHSNLDLIMVEGFKLEDIPKIEVFRPSLGKSRLSRDDDSYIAIATDAPLEPVSTIPTLDLNDIESIADFVCSHI